jgi:hypothetical protein
VVLQEFLTLKFSKLTDLSSLQWNGYSVTGLLHESFDARNQQWNFVKVSYQDSGRGNVDLDEMYVSYGNSDTPVVNYAPPTQLPFLAFGADINQNQEMCVDVLQQCKSFCSFVDNLKLIIPCISAIASCFSRFEYSNSGSLHLGRKVKFDVERWIKDLPIWRLTFFKELQ